jgi:hypothetical protein
MAGDGLKITKVQLARLLGGMVFGGLAAGLFMTLAAKHIDLDDGATMVAVVAGLSYALMGVAVAFGSASPKAGARFLNVEDAEEIREQRRNLGASAAGCVLIGLFLLVLALRPALVPALGREAVALVAVALLVATLVVGFATKRRSDELMRQVSLESSTLTLQVATILLAGWAALAHVDLVRWVSPLGAIAGLAVLQLVAIFWISGKKGLLKTR